MNFIATSCASLTLTLYVYAHIYVNCFDLLMVLDTIVEGCLVACLVAFLYSISFFPMDCISEK